jgi:hypothetical protein
MPKIIYGGLLKNRIKQSMIENEFNKKNEKLALKANLLAKKNKNISKFKPIIYGDLYNKRIAESEKENIINKRLSQLEYSARNEQGQAEALLNQQKVIPAITKEMINEYHEAEKLKPLIIDGEIRKYNKALYEPSLTFDTELESTDKIDRLTEEYNDKKTEIAKRMTDIDNEIISTDDYIKRLKNNPLTLAINYITLQKEIKLKEDLKKEYKQLENEMDLSNIQIRNLKDAYDDVIKNNALVGERNREEVKKFEQSLNEVNKNRLNLQQQPNETEFDYYKRLREIEREKYDPLLYKQYSENEQTKIFKTNLNSFFDNTSFNEDILAKISPEDRFIINKNFDDIEEAFLDQYGYNAKINPKQAAIALKTLANIYKNEERTNATTTINNAIRNQLAKREINKLKANKEEQEENRIKQIRDYENKLKQKRIELTNEEQQKEERRIKQIRDYENKLKQKRNELTNEEQQKEERRIKQIRDYENKLKQKRNELTNEEQQKEENRIKQIRDYENKLKQKRNELTNEEKQIAAQNIQRFARKKLAKNKYNENVKNETKEKINRLNEEVKQMVKNKQKRIELTNEEQQNAAVIINNAIRNQLAKREINKLKANKEAKEKYKNINPNYNLQYEPPPISNEPFVPKFIQDANERKRKNMELYKKYEKTYYPSSNLASSNESLANAANKLKQAYRSHLAKKELINRQIEKSEKNASATNLQRVYKGHLARKEIERKYEELSKGTTVSEGIKKRKERSDKGKKRGPYKEKPPNKYIIPNEVIESNIQDYEPPAARKETGTGLRGRNNPKKRMVKITKEQQMKNRLFLITKEIKAGNDNIKLIIEADKLYKELYGIENAHVFLKR